jgi:predicted GNAT family acetyltransferase
MTTQPAADAPPDFEFVDNTDEHRFEARIDGDVAALADYRLDGPKVVFPHVETEPRWGGQGIATALVKQALDFVIADGHAIQPLCPFVVAFVEKNPAYGEHVAR